MASIKRHERHRVPNPYNLNTFLGSGQLETPLLSPDASCTNVPALTHTSPSQNPVCTQCSKKEEPKPRTCMRVHKTQDMAIVLHRTSLFEKLNPRSWRESRQLITSITSPEDLNLIPSVHVGQLTAACSCSFRSPILF